ncbi:hypothetical protein B0H10DRAFT_2434542 [Mycena sp. CBHHK59/15]|nr:hypothetical protein B0H10DRAFT_2434542 [Mycena sp. CBHHK59/15]
MTYPAEKPSYHVGAETVSSQLLCLGLILLAIVVFTCSGPALRAILRFNSESVRPSDVEAPEGSALFAPVIKAPRPTTKRNYSRLTAFNKQAISPPRPCHIPPCLGPSSLSKIHQETGTIETSVHGYMEDTNVIKISPRQTELPLLLSTINFNVVTPQVEATAHATKSDI